MLICSCNYDANENTSCRLSIFWNLLSSTFAYIKIYKRLLTSYVWQEIWNSPYSVENFNKYAEDIDAEDASPSISMLSEVAYNQGITIIGGSIPEISAGRLFNTCCVIGPDGKLKARHRKVRMWDSFSLILSFKTSQMPVFFFIICQCSPSFLGNIMPIFIVH